MKKNYLITLISLISGFLLLVVTLGMLDGGHPAHAAVPNVPAPQEPLEQENTMASAANQALNSMETTVEASEVISALAWLADQQSETDGGYGTGSASVESLLSIGANGLEARAWRRTPGSPSLMSNIMRSASSYVVSADTAGKLATGLAASDGCWPYDAQKPMDFYDPATGEYADGAGLQGWAILGVAALSDTIPVSAIMVLKDLQQPDGGWEFIPGGFGNGTDTNTTAIAIQALIAAGEPSGASPIVDGLSYLRAAQNTDGGFPYDPDSIYGTDSDTNSSAYVVQAILATGGDPTGTDWQISGTNPMEYLEGMQLPDGSFEWQPGFGSSLFATQQVIPALVGVYNPAKRSELADCPAANALEWLADQQSGVDGGYGTNSSSVESLLSIGANGLDADQWRRSSISPTLMSNIFVNGPDFASTGADAAGKLAVGLAGSNGCWPFGASTPEHYYDPTTGQYAVGAGLQSWAVLGVVALSDTVPISATQFLSSLQQPDGGWEFLPGGFGEGTDTNSTALALQALIATGTAIDSSEVISGLNYLKAAQNNDGGFPYDADSPWGTGSDTNSTSYVVQAIMAAGQNPSDSAWLNDSNSPIDFLLSMQLPDGSFEYQNGFGSNLFATQQAIPALLERSYPLVDTGLNSCPLIFLPFIENN